MVEPSAGGDRARRPMMVREPTPAGVNAFAEVGRGINFAREKLAQQMNRKVLGVVVGDVAIGAVGGAAARIALDMVLGIAGGPLAGGVAGGIKGGSGEWLKQSREIAASGERLSFKENLKRHNGKRIALAVGRGAVIGALGGALGAYAIDQISQTEWGQQAGKFIVDRAGEYARTISTPNVIQKIGAFAKETLPFFKVAPSSAPGLLEPGQIPSLPAIPDSIEPPSVVPMPAEPPPTEIPLAAAPDIESGQLPTAPAVPVEIPPAVPPIAPTPEVGTPLPPSPAAPGEVLLPPQPPAADLTQSAAPEIDEPAAAEPDQVLAETPQVDTQLDQAPPAAAPPVPAPPPPPAAAPPPAAVPTPTEQPPVPDIESDQVADQVEPLPPTVAPNGAEVQGSAVDNSLTYNGKPWILLENGSKNIGHLFQTLGEESGTINQEIMAARLQETADLWAHGQLNPQTHPDLWRLFHLSNGTSSVYNSLLNENTVDSLKNLGIIT